MWAIITKDERIVARDFKNKPEALAYMKFHCNSNNFIVINQNTNKFAMIEMSQMFKK